VTKYEKSKLFLLGVIVTISFMFFLGNTQNLDSKQDVKVGRYQITSSVDSSSDIHTFILDTAEGTIWVGEWRLSGIYVKKIEGLVRNDITKEFFKYPKKKKK